MHAVASRQILRLLIPPTRGVIFSANFAHHYSHRLTLSFSRLTDGAPTHHPSPVPQSFCFPAPTDFLCRPFVFQLVGSDCSNNRGCGLVDIMCYPKYPKLCDIRERRNALRQLQHLIVVPEEEPPRFGQPAVAENLAPVASGGGGGGGGGGGAERMILESSRPINLCICSPTNHVGSFRCRLHRSSYEWGTRRSAASLRRRTNDIGLN